ncbi:polyglutamine-binding protein 1-like [Physella acuta]|uniref:polyglutamine-binding protein 1-like n=1 Tax=Physella acuta TaxID=109671 RepID=UPI0027DDE6E0|nr:polyglutamine-binding protein 1-like [Physella acuta]
MPLPAALQARLAKRGLLEAKLSAKKNTSSKTTEEVEEVFAEDYDDPSKPEAPVSHPTPAFLQQHLILEQPHQGAIDIAADGPIYFETTACPNRSNPYHECVAYCKKRYGMREWDPDTDMLKKKDRMLRKYPLPEGWLQVGDFDTGRYYYWNVNTDEVSWLSPTHPKAIISQSAEFLGIVGKIGDLDSEWEDTSSRSAFINHSGSDTSLSDEEEFIEKRRKPQKRGRQGQGKKDDLDPMDPAAYSDIPRGGWSEGLDQRGKAKTGVDTTASGPLFQQRPYPSPGDILRANQGLKKKK